MIENIENNDRGIYLVKSAIYKDFAFDHSSIEVINHPNRNPNLIILYIKVTDRYGDTTSIEISPHKMVHFKDKSYKYETVENLVNIFRTG